MSKKQLIDRDMFSESIHTAFRKGMDGPYATMMWNLIKLCPEMVWNQWCEEATTYASTVTKWTGPRVQEMIKRVTDEANIALTNDQLPWWYTLTRAFQIMGPIDSRGLASWFNFCIETWNSKEDEKT